LVYLTDDGIRQDLAAATDALTEVSGASPQPWFRCPFGAGHDDSRVLRVVEECGYRNVHWNVEPMDWVEGRTAADVVTSVVEGVDRSPADAVVLLHTWPSATVAALPALLSELSSRGHAFVRIDELDQLPTKSGT
jgi:peptidoglycan/xylan/chitin deacetylase (PgdA/CDA1 family)